MSEVRITGKPDLLNRKIIEVEDHGRYMDHAVFEEGELSFEAWEPADNGAKRCFVLRVYRGDEKIHEEFLPMFYPNQWGVDVSDQQDLNKRADELVEELK